VGPSSKGSEPVSESLEKVRKIKTQLDYMMKNLTGKEILLSPPWKLNVFLTTKDGGQEGEKVSKWISFHFHSGSLWLGVQYILYSQTLKERT
jgi:hypothetical protein